MTGKVRAGLISAGKIGQICARNVPFGIPTLGLASLLDLFVETAKKQAVTYPIPTLYQDDHPYLADNIKNCSYLSSCQSLSSTDKRTKRHGLNIISSFFTIGSRRPVLLPIT